MSPGIKAMITVLGANDIEVDRIPVMYNPSEYSDDAMAKTRGEGSNIRFLRQEYGDFTVALFFDTCDTQSDVNKKTRKIADLVRPQVGVKNIKRPPVCVFSWGTRFKYKGIVTNVQQRFTMFLSNGTPVRAEVSVTFKSVLTVKEEVKATGQEACRQILTIKTGDRLDLVAARTAGDATLWRAIALANDIEDPLSFPRADQIGATLAIPDFY